MTTLNKYTPTEDEMAFALSSVPQRKTQESSIKKSEFAPTEEEMAFAQTSRPEVYEAPEPQPWYKNIPKAALKGLIKGGSTFAETFAPTLDRKGTAQQREFEREVKLEQLLPTEKTEGAQRAERFGKLTGMGGLLGGIPAIAATAAATELGHQAEKGGFGETAQALAETAPYLVPNLSRIIPAANNAQQNLLNFARNMNMTEEQIAPLIHEDNWFTRALARFSKKTGAAEHALEGSQRGLGEIYDQLSLSPQAQVVLNQQQTGTFLNQLRNTFTNLPANLRNEIVPDLIDLSQGPLNGERILNFYQDVNDTIQRIGGPRGRRLVGVQNDLIDAISSVSPQLGQDIRMTNELYSRYATMRNRLRPGPNEDLINSAKGIGAIGFMITGKWPELSALLGFTAAKRLATTFLTNPRFANLQTRLIHALNNNRVVLANEIIQEFANEFDDTDPEFAYELAKEKFKPSDQKK